MAASRRPVNQSALWEGGRERSAPKPAGPPAPVPVDDPDEPAARRSLIGRFVARYGWRAYAMPFLLAATVFTVVDITGSGTPSALADAPATPNSAATAVPNAAQPTTIITTDNGVAETTVITPAAGGLTTDADSSRGATTADPGLTLPANLAVAALPAGPGFTVAGDGTYRVLPGGGTRIGGATAVATYTVEIENGVTVAGGDDTFANFVDNTLADPRSWASVKGVALQRIDGAGAEPDFRITLTSQLTERGICGYSIQLESSCYSRDYGRVVINDARWVRGALTYAGDLTSYREYAVNHEVGHALGYAHQPCETDGGLAPVMMQQSWSTSNEALAAINGSVHADGKVCQPNPWPNSQGAEGEPTATTG